MKKPTTTLLLMVVVGALIAGIVVFRVSNNRSKEAQTTADQLVREFPREAISRIVIQQPMNEVILEKRGEGWLVATQENISADAAAITSLMDQVERARVLATVAIHQDQAANFGLDEANRTTMQIFVQDQRVVELGIGGEGSLPQSVYLVKPEDQRIFLVSLSRRVVARDQWGAAPEDSDQE